MKHKIIDGRFLRTRIGRRVLFLFLVCALAPVCGIGAATYASLRSRIINQAGERLRELSKVTGLGVLERVRSIEEDLSRAASAWSSDQAAGQDLGTMRESAAFSSISVGPTTRFESEMRREEGAPLLTREVVQHLAKNRAVLLSRSTSGRTDIVMVKALDPRALDRGLIWGYVEPGQLWVGADAIEALGRGERLCVFGAAGEELMCRGATPVAALTARDSASLDRRSSYEWKEGEERFLASSWSLFLQYDFLAGNWQFVVSQPKAQVSGMAYGFGLTFALGVAFVAVLAFLLANIQIRRSLDPLVELEQATHQIAAGDWDHEVTITSGDEFQDLAASFNVMARRIQGQLATLTAIGEIDRAVLSAEGHESVIRDVLPKLWKALDCSAVAIGLRSGRQHEHYRVIVNAGGSATEAVTISVPPAETQELLLADDPVVFDLGESSRSYTRIPVIENADLAEAMALPIVLDREMVGFLFLGFADTAPRPTSIISDAKRFAGQLAVAAENIKLVTGLEDMSWATIKALARAVDAKSTWTAGHSERVTTLALAVGREIGLSPEDLDALHRGGLLHDVGKIGVPGSVLDKPGKLTPEEWEKMKAHPQLGANILAPILAFASIIPVVLYHHEKYDGSGYPKGLVGDSIPMLARVLAISDVYDALKHHRPYRTAMTQDEAIAIVRQESGTHFDPAVVNAFLAVMGEFPQEHDRPIAPQEDLESRQARTALA